MSDADLQRWEEIVEREMLGDTITPEDEEFRARYEAEHPECAKESAAWDDMIGLMRDEGEAEGTQRVAALAERVLVQRDVERDVVRPLLPVQAATPRGSNVRGIAIAATLAAAAGVMGLVVTKDWGAAEPTTAQADETPAESPEPAPAPVSPAPAPELAPDAEHPTGLLAMAGEGLLVDGGLASAGAEIQPGQRMDFGEATAAEGADACVVFEAPWIATCFSRASEVVFAEADGGERRVELRRGRIFVTLDELPEGQSFSVVTSRGSVAAIGTSFEVWIDEQGIVRASVLEGKVSITDDDGPRPLEAGQTTVLGEPTIGTFGNDALAWSRGHQQLASLWRAPDRGVLLVRDGAEQPRATAVTVDALPVGAAPVSLLAPEGEHLLAMAGTPKGVPVEIEAGARHEITLDAQPTAQPTPKKRSKPSVAELVRKASEAQADHRYKDAARYLDKLLSHYPDGPDAQNARVQLGDMMREKLGRSGRALELYDAYLRRGGPLTPEARYGRIEALGRLGRKQDQRAAIEDFVAKHPRDWRTNGLEEQLGSL